MHIKYFQLMKCYKQKQVKFTWVINGGLKISYFSHTFKKGKIISSTNIKYFESTKFNRTNDIFNIKSLHPNFRSNYRSLIYLILMKYFLEDNIILYRSYDVCVHVHMHRNTHM